MALLFPGRRALAVFLSALASGALFASVLPSGASAFEMQVTPDTAVTPARPLLPKLERAPLTVARAVAVVAPSSALVQTGTTVIGDGFSESATAPGAWNATSGVCLTAGTPATPATSIAACGSSVAPVDPVGQGALELTTPANNQVGMFLNPTPIATANGIQVTFTDYSFNGTSPGADGTVLFLTDASKPAPTAPGQVGGSLGYANANGSPGLANGYLGLALDEFGNYSNPTEGRVGGPGPIPETIAVRGAASASYPYLGGATVSGKAASLPFSIDQPTLTSRPTNAPTIRMSLTTAGVLSVAIDHHDGNGFVAYYSQAVVGVSGQPAVPANVYVGMVASTGGSYDRHQIGGFAVTTLTPTTSFTPTSIANLKAWYDASTPAAITQGANGAVSSWADKSGHANNLGQSNASLSPVYTSAGIDGLGSIGFSGNQYLIANNAAFSNILFNESTTFVVTNQIAGTQSLELYSGPGSGNPHWSFESLVGSGPEFDFNDSNADGKLAPAGASAGPAVWTAGGSTSTNALLLRKNGNLIASGSGPVAAGGTYQFAMAIARPTAAQQSGQIGEVLMYSRFLSVAESQQVEGYLACKWGLQNRLPSNHPYHTICPQGSAAAPVPTASPSATALQNPPELRSVNGSLVFNVTAQQSANGNPQFIYQGSTVMPTLRLLPGDTLIVNLVNALPVPPAGAAYFNNASLHYHGMHVSPNAPGDDSIDLVAAPGQSLHYQIAIPANHPTGLYWYHSHAHGETDRQNSAGMSGALIVDGIAAYAPQVANMPERVLVVRDAPLAGQALPNGVRETAAAMRYSMSHGMVMGPGAAGRMHMSEARGSTTAATRNPYVLVDPKYRTFVRPLAVSTHCTGTTETPVKALTLNGQAAGTPSIGIRPGEQQFWRLVNAGSDTYVDVQVDNTQMQIIALDGVPIANGVNVPQTMTVSHYVVPPSSRVEFIVTGPPAGTTAFLRTNCFDAGSAGSAMPAETLATIDPTTSLSDLSRTRTTQRIGTRTVQPRNARFITTQPVARSQSFFYSDQNTINGVAYDPSAPPMFYAQSGTVEEWTITNNSSQVHTFHIHQLHFVLEAINGIAQSQEFLLDNVNVPAATANGPGSVKILVDFTDPLDIGTFLLHCHILAHEDGGMMAAIRVGTAPPMTVSNANVSFASATAPAQAVTLSGGKAPFSVTGCSSVANASVSGSTVTISPVGAGSCVLTVSDSSGLTATISVSVAAAAPKITLAPTSVSFTTPTSPAQPVTISGGTPGYTVAGCSGVATGTVSGSTLTVTPVAAGSCSMTVTDAAANTQTLAVSVNAVVTGSAQDNLTFHQNAARLGWYQAETALNTTNVASTSFGMIATLSAPSGMPAFGKVYAQPLYATNETVADGTKHNLVLIATSTDQVYAFDDATRTVVWHRDFTNAAAGIRQQLSTDTACDDVNPNVGIVATPVIDRTLDRMYVAVPTYESGVFHLRLHAISLKSGLEATGTSGSTINPVEISGSATLTSGGIATTSAEWNFSRAALLEANGNVYVGLGSHCDFQPGIVHGWLLAYNATTLAAAGNAVNLTDTNDGSSFYMSAIWASGFGPAADAQGNVFVTTGNGAYNGTTNFAMSAVRIPGNLDATKATTFTPFGVFKDSENDADFGSGGIVLLPDQTGSFPHIAVAGGKCGSGTAPDPQGRVGTAGCQKYVLNRDNLGGRQSNDAGALWHADTAGGMWGGPTYFADSTGVQHVVYNLNTYNLSLNPISLTVQSTGTVAGGCLECRDAGAQPIVSSNGTTAGTAIVWALQTPNNSGGTIKLYAFDALNFSHTLFSGSAGTWTAGSGAVYIGGALISPLVANGKVYVPSDGVVTVFGLH
jgi:FtsP/CotA-like multicopper oxidase with cupredoxin domain